MMQKGKKMDDRGYDWYIDEVIGDVSDESN
jgi:hypothetical protein